MKLIDLSKRIKRKCFVLIFKLTIILTLGTPFPHCINFRGSSPAILILANYSSLFIRVIFVTFMKQVSVSVRYLSNWKFKIIENLSNNSEFISKTLWIIVARRSLNSSWCLVSSVWKQWVASCCLFTIMLINNLLMVNNTKYKHKHLPNCPKLE